MLESLWEGAPRVNVHGQNVAWQGRVGLQHGMASRALRMACTCTTVHGMAKACQREGMAKHG